MKITKKILALTALLAFSVKAQQPQQLPTVSVGGNTYYYYDVQPKETVFSISRRLGMTPAQLIEANPATADGLQAYTRLYFPVEAGEVSIVESVSPGTVHEVAKGETLYGISRRYGVSVDDIITLNPGARNGVRPGDRLTISLAAAPEPSKVSPTPASNAALTPHTIAQGETLYRIASEAGITVEMLLQANPSLDAFNYTAGTEILVPGANPGNPDLTATPVPVKEPQIAPQPKVTPMTAEEAPSAPAATIPSAPLTPAPQIIAVTEPLPQGPDTLRVALMLPFMLNEQQPSRPAALYTDFYRGFLMGLDTATGQGTPMKVEVFDTAANADTIAAILSRPFLSRANLVVGPDNEQALQQVLQAVDPDETFVMSPFVVKNTAYQSRTNSIQPNIPHTMMYDKAAAAFTDLLDGRTPVFLSRIKGQAEKDPFTTELKARFTDRGIPFREITFRDALTAEDLEGLEPAGRYAFIPVSGQRAEFLKFKDALIDLARANPGANILLGYPDWVTFRGDLRDDLGELSATIYTRFFFDPDNYMSKEAVRRFNERYGADPTDGAPLQAILGYDTARFIIAATAATGGDFHLRPVVFDGLQSDFRLDDSGDIQGLVNTSLMLVKFRKGGIAERTRL